MSEPPLRLLAFDCTTGTIAANGNGLGA